MYTRSAERSSASLKGTAEPMWLLMDHRPWMDPFAGRTYLTLPLPIARWNDAALAMQPLPLRQRFATLA